MVTRLLLRSPMSADPIDYRPTQIDSLYLLLLLAHPSLHSTRQNVRFSLLSSRSGELTLPYSRPKDTRLERQATSSDLIPVLLTPLTDFHAQVAVHSAESRAGNGLVSIILNQESPDALTGPLDHICARLAISMATSNISPLPRNRTFIERE